MELKGILALTIGAMISIATALAHLSCIFLGPACYKAQLAPPKIVQSAVDGTLLAPMGNLLVSSLFVACGLFALSGAGLIKRLPLQNLALITISGICILRGLSTVPASYMFPEVVSNVSIIAGTTWFITGLLFAYGYMCVRRESS